MPESMAQIVFDTFFQGDARDFLFRGIDLALDEDGPDLTSNALFGPEDMMQARIVAKEDAVMAGLPLVELILDRTGDAGTTVSVAADLNDGDLVRSGIEFLCMEGPARTLLKAERVILNFLSHLSGIATLTRSFAARIEGYDTRLLDTRKTLPGLRYPEKYAVRVGGGQNHRLDLAEMLMLKDNHIDRAGGIAQAVGALRRSYSPCPPIEVECRCVSEVDEAVACGVERIMLDNMSAPDIAAALKRIPPTIESEISGGVTIDTVADLAACGADFISVGCITNSARAIDMSMRLAKQHKV